MQFVDEQLSSLIAFYQDLHRHPELSHEEARTAARVAAQWRAAGIEVTENVGGHGIVGVLKNGPGKTLLLRTDLDALPLVEETGLPYASTVKADLDGEEVGVMHACGHDVHMTVLSGAVHALARMKDRFTGTIVFIGQPAEERGAGAEKMLADGLYTRFPRPDAALALHVDANLKAGDVGYTSGFVMANVDSVDVTVFGRGGHGAAPHETLDPIVLAARIITGWQTITSRELAPTDPAVVTVGSIHGGTKHNLIPNRVDLELTVRSYSPETRKQILASIERIAHGIAKSAGVPDALLPKVQVLEEEHCPSLYNDPELVAQVVAVFQHVLGADRVHARQPEMIGEDFSRYGLVEPRIPIFMFRLGAVAPDAYERAQRGELDLPGLHNSQFAPDADLTIWTGVRTMTSAALEFLSAERKEKR